MATRLIFGVGGPSSAAATWIWSTLCVLVMLVDDILSQGPIVDTQYGTVVGNRRIYNGPLNNTYLVTHCIETLIHRQRRRHHRRRRRRHHHAYKYHTYVWSSPIVKINFQDGARCNCEHLVNYESYIVENLQSNGTISTYFPCRLSSTRTATPWSCSCYKYLALVFFHDDPDKTHVLMSQQLVTTRSTSASRLPLRRSTIFDGRNLSRSNRGSESSTRPSTPFAVRSSPTEVTYRAVKTVSTSTSGCLVASPLTSW